VLQTPEDKSQKYGEVARPQQAKELLLGVKKRFPICAGGNPAGCESGCMYVHSPAQQPSARHQGR